MKTKARVLKKQEGQLSLAGGFFGTAQFGLSGDRQSLMVADQSYKKISNIRLDEMKLEIEAVRSRQKENSKLCETLKEEYKKKQKLITEQSGSNLRARSAKQKELRKKFKIKEKEISNCRV